MSTRATAAAAAAAAVACENIVRHQLFSPRAVGTRSSRSAEGGSGGRDALGFPRHGAPRGTGGAGAGSGGPGAKGARAHRERPPPGTTEQRLLRMVATLALGRLQRLLDPLGLFKRLRLSIVRRRLQSGGYGSIRNLALDVQRLCAEATTTFGGAGSVRREKVAA